ncbi:spore germination protein [Bacillus sp. es.036]|uniref:spore germination protein n=1 Tax=Bacillus sp. es.036 TaxID=1761764 RepID=UPI000BF7164D|nr:spore germination protein [Bacillus sp. es.036]PFG12587.1 spore germination protein PA [Bacillus sp. es.036]
MPAIVGAIKVNTMGSSAVFHVGDVFVVSPTSVIRTFAGGGSFNTGDGLNVSSSYSVTSVDDSDVADQNVVANI